MPVTRRLSSFSSEQPRAATPAVLSALGVSALGVCALGVCVLGACSAPVDADGSPGFNAPPFGAGGAANNAQVGAAGTPAISSGGSTGTSPAFSGEQNPNNPTPLNPGSSGGSGGAPLVSGAAGSAAGVAGSGANAGGAGGAPPVAPPVTPPAGSTPEEITAFFDALPCGAKYTALGDGGWQFCLRLADGGAACSRSTAEFTRVTFAGGAAVTNVAQVSGQRDSGVGVVTTAGALHVGGVTSIGTAPLIASGVVNYSGGFHASVALVAEGDGFGVLSWTDNGAPAPVTLPNGEEPIQVSANYGLACALSTAGNAYCWNAGGNHSLQLTDAPTRVAINRPLQMISVGQNSVCGVSFDSTLECVAAWYDSPFLPTEGSAPNFQVRASTFPSIREVHAGFGQGIVVRSDGTAVFLAGGVVPPADNPGQPFTGVTNVIAAGGDRGSACVQTQAGAVFCRVGTGVAQATVGGAPLVAQAAACPL